MPGSLCGLGDVSGGEVPSAARRFAPPAEFVKRANVVADWHDVAAADMERFWGGAARRLRWARDWDQVLDWSHPPFARWFVNGRLNVAVNCLDRHVDAGRGDQVAFYWEGEQGATRTLTYAQLRDRVCQAANALSALGVQAGDRVVIYLPMIPEAVIAMLACARLGAPHAVVSNGLSASALAARMVDCAAKVLVTADEGFSRGRLHDLKSVADQALRECPEIRHVLVVRRTGQAVGWRAGRDVWWHDLVDAASVEHSAASFDAEHPLCLLYASGTAEAPRAVLHTTGGYLTHCAYSHRVVFDVKPAKDVYWCTADLGTAMGHSYVVYGPLVNRTTSLLYEGGSTMVDIGRWWEMIDRYQVSVLYAAPAMIRASMAGVGRLPARYDLSSLRLLGSGGEPLSAREWMWLRRDVGHDRCPVVDTWWQPDTGAIMVSPLPGVTATKPGCVTKPLPGISVAVVDQRGRPVGHGQRGALVVDRPWPAMPRGIWGDQNYFQTSYWSRYRQQGFYFTGQAAAYDADGDLWLVGADDDVVSFRSPVGR